MGSHRVGDRRIFLKISEPLSLINTFQMNLIQPDPFRWTILLTINVPVVYMARDVMILMRAISIPRAIGRVPGVPDFYEEVTVKST